MKRIKSIAFFLILALFAAFFTGCQRRTETGTGPQIPSIYVFIANRGDLGYWDSIAEGGDWAARDFAGRAVVRVIETTHDVTANRSAMYEAADAGAAMIITAGDFRDNMIEVALQFPDIAFVMISEDIVHEAPNIYAFDFLVSEAAFIGGMVAADVATSGIAGTNSSGVIGFIGSMDEALIIQEFYVGYIQGAKYYDPSIRIVTNYVGGWRDPNTARTQALAQFNDARAEIIFACAGGSGNGVHSAAAEVGKFVIGVDSDQSLMYASDPQIQSRFVTSVLKLVNNAIYYTIDRFLTDGTLPFGEYEIFGIAENAAGVVTNDLYHRYVSIEGQSRIEQAKAAVTNGTVEIQSVLGMSQAEISALINELLR